MFLETIVQQKEKMEKKTQNRLAWGSLLFTIVAAISALFVVPEFRRIVGLEEPHPARDVERNPSAKIAKSAETSSQYQKIEILKADGSPLDGSTLDIPLLFTSPPSQNDKRIRIPIYHVLRSFDQQAFTNPSGRILAPKEFDTGDTTLRQGDYIYEKRFPGFEETVFAGGLETSERFQSLWVQPSSFPVSAGKYPLRLEYYSDNVLIGHADFEIALKEGLPIRVFDQSIVAADDYIRSGEVSELESSSLIASKETE